MGRQPSPPPQSATPFGISNPNIVTPTSAVPIISPSQNPGTPALPSYSGSPAVQAPDVNNPALDGGGGSVQDQLAQFRQNRQGQVPFFGQY